MAMRQIGKSIPWRKQQVQSPVEPAWLAGGTERRPSAEWWGEEYEKSDR